MDGFHLMAGTLTSIYRFSMPVQISLVLGYRSDEFWREAAHSIRFHWGQQLLMVWESYRWFMAEFALCIAIIIRPRPL